MKNYAVLYLSFWLLSVSAQSDLEKFRIQENTNWESLEQLKDYNSFVESERMRRINESGIERNVVDSSKRLVDIVDGQPLYEINYNTTSAQAINVDEINSNGAKGLSLDGQGMTVGIWEVGGNALTNHNAYIGRVNIIDGTVATQFHATHVTGTILGDGTASSGNLGKGMAPLASAVLADTNSDIAEMQQQALNNGLLVSNHSYGYRLDASTALSLYGSYDSRSLQMDLLTNTFPYLLPVMAAGNSRNDGVNIGKGGYDLVAGIQTSKNGLVVAAVGNVFNYTGPASVQMSNFSSWGPTDDGRIRPDISAKGVGVLSTSNAGPNSYAFSSGTSMASPAIAGLAILLQQHYGNLNAGSSMRSATLRGVITHTAKEAGRNPGPDYEFGWGLADASAAVDLISNNGSTSFMEEVDYTGSPRTLRIVANGNEPLKVMIVWNDRPGTASNGTVDDRTPELVNDLDLKLTRNGVTYFPWTLNVNIPAAGAVRTQRNDVDNIEQVQVDAPTAGDIFDVEISNDGPISGTQNYSLLVTGGVPVNLSTLENQFGADKELTVYPNPASQFITLKSLEALKNIQVINAVGAVVTKLQSVEEGHLINVSNLSSGVYFVQGENAKGNVVQTRFIKK